MLFYTCIIYCGCSRPIRMICIWGLVEFRRAQFGRGNDTVGNPHRAPICQFENLSELFLLLELNKHFSIEQIEPTVSSPLLT